MPSYPSSGIIHPLMSSYELQAFIIMTPLKNLKNWSAIQENTLWWLSLPQKRGGGQFKYSDNIIIFQQPKTSYKSIQIAITTSKISLLKINQQAFFLFSYFKKQFFLSQFQTATNLVPFVISPVSSSTTVKSPFSTSSNCNSLAICLKIPPQAI